MRSRSNKSASTLQPEPLAAMARQAFAEIQGEMQRLAPAVAKARSMKTTDYRDVIRALKRNSSSATRSCRTTGSGSPRSRPSSSARQLVTLPEREARIRIATDAEAAQSPAPNMRPPRLLGNTGEMGEFILPLNMPAAAGSRFGGASL